VPAAPPENIQLQTVCFVQILCIRFFLNCAISFRSIPKIIEQFDAHMAQKIGWCPHFTSVINWMHRLGLGLLNQVKKTNREWIAIVDHSIGVGTKKALVVLRVSVDALYERGGAVRLEDCECVGLSVSKSVNGEDTAAALEKIFAVSGEPVGIIKDCDASLNKAVRLTSEQHGSAICAIDDIGHALACGLKADY
jgi:hypothetical protein